jgi:hypothetical protein
LAANGGEVATPSLPVLAVVVLLPPTNVAPASDPFELAPPPVDPTPRSVNVTVTPVTGWPVASITRTDSGCLYWPPAIACWRIGDTAVTVAGIPAAVLVSEKLTDPYAVWAMIV